MSFLGIGVGEALLIAVLTLLLVGPQRFPELMRQAGRWYKIARGFTSEVMKDVRSAVDEIEQEVNSETEDLRSVRDLTDVRQELEDDFNQAKRDADAAGEDVESAARSGTEGLEERSDRSGRSSGRSSASRPSGNRSSRLLRHARETPRSSGGPQRPPPSPRRSSGADSSPSPRDDETEPAGPGSDPGPTDPPAPRLSADEPPGRRPSVKRDPIVDEDDPFKALEERRSAASQDPPSEDGDGAARP